MSCGFLVPGADRRDDCGVVEGPSFLSQESGVLGCFRLTETKHNTPIALFKKCFTEKVAPKYHNNPQISPNKNTTKMTAEIL